MTESKGFAKILECFESLMVLYCNHNKETARFSISFRSSYSPYFSNLGISFNSLKMDDPYLSHYFEDNRFAKVAAHTVGSYKLQIKIE